MKSLFFALVLAITSLTGCFMAAASPSDGITSTQDLAYKTVSLVEAGDDGGVQAYCTGVWVSDSVIASALHCTEHENPGHLFTYVVLADLTPNDAGAVVTKGHGGLVMAKDEAHDLVLIRTQGTIPQHGVAYIAADVEVGDTVMTMGSPLGLMYSYSRGYVSALRTMESVGGVNMEFVQTTAPISPGNSGGALFNTYGSVVGICHATFTTGQNINVFIHYNYLSALMKKAGV